MLKEIALVCYRTNVQTLIRSFLSIPFEHVSQVEIDVPNEKVDVKVMKTTLRATAANLILLDSFDEKDWQTSIKEV